jgi:hypothetical protein
MPLPGMAGMVNAATRIIIAALRTHGAKLLIAGTK